MEVVVSADEGVNDPRVIQNDLKTEMISHIVTENKAFFKSQQIDDPEIDLEERKTILEGILQSSHAKFLSRFGPYLNPEHFAYFSNQHYHPEEKYEIEHYIADLRETNIRVHVNVRNRRYEALQKMIKDGSYFSEIEMMRREPLLYEQLIGQYLTENEIRRRDRAEGDPTSFLNVLLEGIDRDHTNELRKQQQNEEHDTDEEDTDSLSNHGDDSQKSFNLDHDNSDDDKFPKVPPSYRKQWGNFEDEPFDPHKINEVAAHSVATKCNPHKKFKTITADEKNVLREEFLGIMYSKFLTGYDKNFDYSKVDQNAEYDNLEMKARDEEDKYFDSEDVDEAANEKVGNIMLSTRPRPADESEDELDAYMKQLDAEKEKSVVKF